MSLKRIVVVLIIAALPAAVLSAHTARALATGRYPLLSLTQLGLTLPSPKEMVLKNVFVVPNSFRPLFVALHLLTRSSLRLTTLSSASGKEGKRFINLLFAKHTPPPLSRGESNGARLFYILLFI